MAHGIGPGLEALPYLGEGDDYPLEVGMTFSLELKVAFAGEGAMGAKQAVVVIEYGYEVLAPVDEEIFEL